MHSEQKTKGLIKNISSLLLVQIANYILPFFSIPIMVRIIGPEKFGVINLAATICTYFVWLVNYGFDFTATRKVAQNTNNKTLIDELFNVVLGAKLVLTVISCIIFLILFQTIIFFKAEPKTVIYSFILVFSCILTPNWLYQGKQQLFRISIFNLLTKVLFTIGIISLIRNKEDYYLHPLLISTSQIIVAIASFTYAIKIYNIKLYWVGFRKIFTILYEERFVYFSTVAMSLYMATTTIILGWMSPVSEVGYFSAAQKLIIIAQAIINVPLAQSLFPFIGNAFSQSAKSGIDKIQKIIPIVSTISIISCILILLLGSIAIKLLYGSQFYKSIIPLQIMSLIPFIVCINNMLGIQGMINLKMDRQYFNIIFYCGLASIITNCILAKFYGAIGSSIAWLLTEILITLTIIFYLNSKQIPIFKAGYFRIEFIKESIRTTILKK